MVGDIVDVAALLGLSIVMKLPAHLCLTFCRKLRSSVLHRIVGNSQRSMGISRNLNGVQNTKHNTVEVRNFSVSS